MGRRGWLAVTATGIAGGAGLAVWTWFLAGRSLDVMDQWASVVSSFATLVALVVAIIGLILAALSAPKPEHRNTLRASRTGRATATRGNANTGVSVTTGTRGSLTANRTGDANSSNGTANTGVDVRQKQVARRRVPPQGRTSRHSDRGLRHKVDRTGNAQAGIYANSGIHIGDNNLYPDRLIEFEHIGMPGRADSQWDEFPHTPNVLECNFADNCRRLFSLKKLIYPADLFFDLVLLNRGNSPTVLSRVGIKIVAVQQILYMYGYPESVKIRPASDEYEILMPDLQKNYDVGFGRSMEPDTLNLRIEHTLENPVYLPAGAPYRYILRLRKYQENIPNHAQIQLLANVGNRTELSSKIHIFTR